MPESIVREQPAMKPYCEKFTVLDFFQIPIPASREGR